MAKDNIKISINGNGADKCLLVIINIQLYYKTLKKNNLKFLSKKNGKNIYLY